MFNLFKTKIPTGETKEVTELESWTVKWEVCTSLRWGESVVKHKAFIKESEMVDFKIQLRQAAEFIGTVIDIKSWKN